MGKTILVTGRMCAKDHPTRTGAQFINTYVFFKHPPLGRIHTDLLTIPCERAMRWKKRVLFIH